MKNLILCLMLLTIYGNLLTAQFEKKHIYEHSNIFLNQADIFLNEENNPILLVQGKYSVLSKLDTALFSSWNIEMNNILPSINEKTPRSNKINFSNLDSVYFYGSEMQIGESDEIAILLLNFNYHGDTLSSKKIQFEHNYLFKDMLYDGDHHFVIGSDGETSFFSCLDNNDSVVWANQYRLVNRQLSLQKLVFESDSTFLAYGDENDDGLVRDVLIRMDKKGNVISAIRQSEESATPKDIFKTNDQIFTLSHDMNNFRFTLTILNEVDSLSKSYSSYAEFSENFQNAFHIIHANDSIVYFTSSLQLFQFNYKTEETKSNDSYLDFISSAYVEETKEFYLLNKVGSLPVLSYSDIQSIGLLYGKDLEISSQNCDEFCIGNIQVQLNESAIFQDSIAIVQDSLNYTYLNIPIEINFNPLKEKEGCLDPGNSVFEESLASSIFISPNPSNGNFRIRNEKGAIDKIYLYDMMGILIQEIEGNGENIQELIIDNCKGTYFMTIISGEKRATKKIIIH